MGRWRSVWIVLSAVALIGSGGPPCDSPDACHALGDRYENGVRPDPARAAKLYATGCRRGHGPSCDALGSMLWRGAGVPSDPYRAVSLYEKACRLGDGEGCADAARSRRSDWGRLYDEDRAVAHARSGCALDSGNACNELGILNGRGLGGDRGSAVDAYRRACDLGFGSGCENLADLLVRGRGVTQDLPLARSLLHQACASGVEASCVEEGRFLSEGIGTERDPEGAVGLFERGCTTVHTDGCRALAWALVRGRGTAADPERARRLLGHACDADDADACTDLAHLLEQGIGGPVDADAARVVLNAACDRKLGDACLALGRREVRLGRVANVIGAYQRACRAGETEACRISPSGVVGDRQAQLRGACRAGHGPSCLGWAEGLTDPDLAAQARAAAREWTSPGERTPPVADRPPVDEGARACFSEVVATLTSPALAGRGPGPGAEATAAALAERFRREGLDPLDGRWRIPFDGSWDREWRGGTLTVDGQAVEGWGPYWASAAGSFEGAVVRPDRADLEAGVGLAGAVVVVPDAGAYWLAARAGAVAAIVRTDDLAAWVDGRSGAFQLAGYSPTPTVGIPVLGVSPSVLLPGSSRLAGTVPITGVPHVLENVVGVIPGRGVLASEVVVVGAHYDHLGVDRMQRVRLGADDNASGVAAMVCSLAGLRTALAEAPSARTVVVVGFGGEELGLLGSRAFVETGVVPTSAIAAMVNLDMVGRLGDQVLRFRGVGSGPFVAPIVSAGAASELPVDPSVPAEPGVSDHVSFLDVGVPSLMLFTGTHHEYHEPLDEPELLDVDGGARIARFTTALVAGLATGDRPVFTAGCGGVTEAPLGLRLHLAAPVVQCVEPEGPAAAYGLAAGDRILKVGAWPVVTRPEVEWAIELLWPVERMPITVSRAGRTLELAPRR